MFCICRGLSWGQGGVALSRNANANLRIWSYAGEVPTLSWCKVCGCFSVVGLTAARPGVSHWTCPEEAHLNIKKPLGKAVSHVFPVNRNTCMNFTLEVPVNFKAIS